MEKEIHSATTTSSGFLFSAIITSEFSRPRYKPTAYGPQKHTGKYSKRSLNRLECHPSHRIPRAATWSITAEAARLSRKWSISVRRHCFTSLEPVTDPAYSLPSPSPCLPK